MSKSGRVRLSDLRRAFRLIHDCRDVGHDPSAWPAVVATGLRSLIGAQVVIIGRMEFGPDSAVRHIEMADCGWLSHRHRELWYRRTVVESDPGGSVTFQRFVSAISGQTTRTRDQLVEDAEWYRSYEYNEVFRPAGSTGLLASFAPVSGGRAIFGSMNSRPPGEREFDARERRLLHLFHVELGRLLGTSVLLDATTPLTGLPPRLRQTLECLLDGDSEKQAALCLGLSRHTVHDYVTALYRRLGVSSRAELMTLCLRHPPPGANISGPATAEVPRLRSLVPGFRKNPSTARACGSTGRAARHAHTDRGLAPLRLKSVTRGADGVDLIESPGPACVAQSSGVSHIGTAPPESTRFILFW